MLETLRITKKPWEIFLFVFRYKTIYRLILNLKLETLWVSLDSTNKCKVLSNIGRISRDYTDNTP